AELFTDVLLPADLAALSFEAGEVTVRAQRVDGVSVNGGGGPRLGVEEITRVADVADVRGPDRLSILSRESMNKIIVHAAVAHQVDSSSDDRRRRIAISYVVHLPEQFGSLDRPLFKQAALLRYPVTTRTSPLRPVGRQSSHPGRSWGREA